MPFASIPAADATVCSGWNQQATNLYNRLDFYFAKKQVERRKWYPTWSRFLGKTKWTPNQGPTMRTVITEPSPHIRQFAFPNPITGTPKMDVIDIRERKVDEVVYEHDFESLVLNFLPDFQDFMTHVNDNSKDIMEKQERYEDVFYRGRIFHRSPFVWLPNSPAAGGELTPAPVGTGNAAGTDAKSTAWLQFAITQLGNPGYLSMATLNKAITVFEDDVGAVSFAGPDQPKENSGMMNKYALVCSSEAFNQFSMDPYLLGRKNCDLDVVYGRFQGSMFGRLTSIIESKPMRFKADGTFPAPEVRELNPDAPNYGETVPNPVYTSLDDVNGCPYEVAFLVGASGYDVINVGPPPAAFSGSGMPDGFGKMFWNGEIVMTKNFLITCQTDDGTFIQKTNQYGKHLKFISAVTYGIRGYQVRFIMPIIFKRKRGE